nr:hypothetical protein [Bacteroidota bacterium]
YDIVLDTTKNGALDSLNIDFYYFAFQNLLSKQILTHIPRHTVTVTPINCIIKDTTFVVQSADSLYPQIIYDPLQNLKIRVAAFEKGDTIRIQYNTVRCAETDEASLLNKEKHTNHWRFETKGYQPCGKVVTGARFTSNESKGPGNYNLHQKLSFSHRL